MWFAGVYVYLRPTTLEEALEALYQSRGELLAGGTDFYPSLGERLPAKPIVDITRVRELKGITRKPDLFRIGGGATWTELIKAPLPRCFDALKAAAREIGSVQIQNRGTLGGNIANASPAGDTLPILLATDATILVGGQRGEREIPATEFFTAYRQTALAPDELILHVTFPLPKARELSFRKVGTRRAQAISKVVLAAAWRDDGPRGLAEVRVALGSVAAIPIRARATEAVLEGALPIPEVADRAAETLANEIEPIDDVRSTAGYRRTVAARVLHRLVREAGGW